MSIDDDTKEAVISSLRAYAEAYSRKDLGMIMALTAPDYFGFGSGPDEKVSSLDELRSHLERDFAQSGNLKMEIGPSLVSAEGNVAWVACECTISASVSGKKYRYEGRMSAVMKKVGERWLIVHTHFAVPDRSQDEGQSFSTR